MMARKRNRTRVAWHRVYLALTAISTVVLGLVLSDTPPFADLRPVAAGALIVALFAAASIAHWYDASLARRRAEEEPPDFPATLNEEIRYRDESEDAEDREENREEREQ